MMEEKTFEVRGNVITLSYSDNNRRLTVESDRVKEYTDNQDPQEFLANMGVYTRVEEVMLHNDGVLIVTIKPAASVELRASEENNTKLLKRPVSSTFEGGTITKRRGKYGYNATISMETLERAGINHREPTSVYPEVKDDMLALRVISEDAPHSMITRIDSTGLIGIPNGIASAVDLDGHGVEWEVDNSGELVGKTTAKLPYVSFEGRNKGSDTTITRVAQSSVEHNGDEWSQEHFKCYLLKEHAEVLDVDSDDYIDMELINANGFVGIRITSDVRSKFVKTTEDGGDSLAPCVRKLYSGENNQLNFYMSNGLVHSLGLSGEKMYWITDETVLNGCKARQIFDLTFEE